MESESRADSCGTGIVSFRFRNRPNITTWNDLLQFNWYSRRVGLAAIYKMTELYLMQDSSADHAATWQFLSRRVEEASQVHAVMIQSETGVQFAKEVASATFTTVSWSFYSLIKNILL